MFQLTVYSASYRGQVAICREQQSDVILSSLLVIQYLYSAVIRGMKGEDLYDCGALIKDGLAA